MCWSIIAVGGSLTVLVPMELVVEIKRPSIVGASACSRSPEGRGGSKDDWAEGQSSRD